MQQRSRTRAGFTLVEILVASVVASIVVLAARGLYDALAASLDHVRRATATADGRANGDRVLRQLVRNAEAHVDPDSAFVGDAVAARFVSSCQSPRGWLERHPAALGIVDSARWSLVIVQCPLADSTVAMRVPGPVTLRYLTSEAQGSTWVDSWSAGQMPPRAIGIRTGHDMMILPLGVRW